MTATCQVVQGDCRDLLATLPDESVHMVCTSPPYFGLRSYNGGEAEIGLEESPAEYVEKLVAVFREVRRVLHPSGTVWCNLGDSYASNWPCNRRNTIGAGSLENGKREARPPRMGWNLKDKDLMMIPARVAIALQDDGWWLRQEICWAKKAPMPESVTDRCTRSHEMVFMLTKSERYFYDAQAIAEPASGADRIRSDVFGGNKYTEGVKHSDGSIFTGAAARNKRDVWFLSPEQTPFAHFATMPQALVEPCILAGSSAKGCCPECLAPWQRVVERTGHVNQRESAHVPGNTPTKTDSTGWAPVSFATNTWEPTCTHSADPIPCTVLDPFAGSGTTLAVALRLGRNAIGLELNPEYIELINQRISGVTLPLPLEEGA